MEHLIEKTGLSLAIAQALKDLDLERDQKNVQALLLDVFNQKFDTFKRNHEKKYHVSHFQSHYVFENEFPVGENDKHQYFRCLAYEARIGIAYMTMGTDTDRKPFTIVEGFSRNEDYKKKPFVRMRSSNAKGLGPSSFYKNTAPSSRYHSSSSVSKRISTDSHTSSKNK